MKINKKFLTTLLIGLSTSLALTSISLLNSNKAIALNADNTSSTKNSYASSLSPRNEIDKFKIKVNDQASFKSDLKELSFWGNDKPDNLAYNSRKTFKSFWIDSSDNSININPNVGVVNSRGVPNKIRPKIIINITNNKTKTKSSQTIYSRDNGSKFISWSPPTSSGWTSTNNSYGGSDYKLTLKDGQTTEINLHFNSWTNENDRQQFRFTSNSGSQIDGNSLDMETKFNKHPPGGSWNEHIVSFVTKTNTVPPPATINSRSKRSALYSTQQPRTTKTSIFWSTNNNYSSDTVDNSSSIRNLQINWDNLWNVADATALHEKLKNKTSVRAHTPAVNNIFTFDKVTADSVITIDKAFGWADKQTNTYTLKYSGTVESGVNLENLYTDKDFNIKNQKFTHLITLDFNSRGITRTDITDNKHHVPSYAFNVTNNKLSSKANSDPYQVVKNKNPHKIGLVGNSKYTTNDDSNNINNTDLSVWVDQNGLNVDSNVKITGTGGVNSQELYNVEYTKYNSDYEKIDQSKKISIPTTANLNNYYGWSKPNDEAFIRTKKNQYLLPLSESLPMVEVKFTYVDNSSNGSNDSMLKYVAGRKPTVPNPSIKSVVAAEPILDAESGLSMLTKTVDRTKKTKTTSVIVYRGADGMNHMLWDTTNTSNYNFEDNNLKMFKNDLVENKANQTFTKSEYEIDLTNFEKKIESMFSTNQNTSLKQVMEAVVSDPSFANTIEVNGRNAPRIAITLSIVTDDKKNQELKFDIKAKNIDASNIVNANLDTSKVSANIVSTQQMYVNQYGDIRNVRTVVPLIPYPKKIELLLPVWAIATIAVGIFLIIIIPIIAFRKLRGR